MGKTLYGPMLFVQPESRAVVANEADASGLLQKQGDVYAGVLPKDVMIANTAVDWAGKRWTMVMWPLLWTRSRAIDCWCMNCSIGSSRSWESVGES